MVKIKKEGQGRLFENPFLEIFTKTNPFIHIVTYSGCIASCFYLSNEALSSGWSFILFGIFIWTLFEYLIHRFLFHINESRFQYAIHGVHHEYPRDRERLMMPPVPGIIIITLLYFFFFIFLRGHTPLFMTGFIFGYLVYTFIHYIIHAWKPVRGIKFLWSHHHKHHNPAFENKAFGVSTPLWDYVFGTMPARGTK